MPPSKTSRETAQVPALDAGLRLLARRAHSRVELRLKLARRGYEPDAVATALARLDELGYLDDEAYARSLIRLRGGGRGRRLIAAELAQRGVDRDTVRTALSALKPEDEVASARRLAARMGLRGGEGAEAGSGAAARVAARLVRRGFSRETVTAALAELKAETS